MGFASYSPDRRISVAFECWSMKRLLQDQPEGRSMSNVLSHSSVRHAEERRSRPLPIGVGLLIGAAASLGLWGGVFWLGAKILG